MSAKKRRGNQSIAPLTRQSGIGKNVLQFAIRDHVLFSIWVFQTLDAEKVSIRWLLREVKERFAFALEIFSYDKPW